MPSSTRAPATHHVSLAESAVAELRGRIASGQWPVGCRIPPEPALVRLLHVGRNTVREAVQALVHAGLLERRQGSGTYVLADSELTVALHRRLCGAGLRHVLEVRRGLEVEAARLAALRRTDAEVARLRDLDERCRAALAAGDLDTLVDADLALHRAVATAARNPVLDSLYAHLLDAVRESVVGGLGRAVKSARVAGVTGSPTTHGRLVDAIAIGDDEAAAREVTAFHTRRLAPLR